MSIHKLALAQLRHVYAPHQLAFETTAELENAQAIIGQPRGVRAIEFGISIQSQGYNIYVLSEVRPDLTTAIVRFLQTQTTGQATPQDWVYVHNFVIPHQPQAIGLPPRDGRQFKSDVDHLVTAIKKELPEAFNTDAYREAAENLDALYKRERQQLLADLREQAADDHMAIVETASGFAVWPIVESQVVADDEYQQLLLEGHREWERQREAWAHQLDGMLRQMREIDAEAREQFAALSSEVAAASIKHYFDQLHQRYSTHQEILAYLEAVYDDVLQHLGDFTLHAEKDGEADLRRYAVNLLIDNAAQTGPPVVVELDPRYTNLLGRIEYEMQHGGTSTHLSNIKAGSLHRANGGYLILNVRDLLAYREAWEALKRAIKSREIRVQSPDQQEGGRVLAKSLAPQPIPLHVKIILLGSAEYYYSLYNREEDFAQLFKVKAEFGFTMPRDREHEQAYAQFIAGCCDVEQLCHFDRTAVAQIIEFGSRLCGHQHKLSTRFGLVADVIREASYWASRHGRSLVTAIDVKQALDERQLRSNLEQELTLHVMNEGSLHIATTGTAIGQINGLSVIDVGDYTYGEPSRITASTYCGERGVVSIDREVELTDAIHHKGLLALTGYLGRMYAQEQPLSLAANITFEQNYSHVMGDSASSAELYTILSSLGHLPLKQGIAVTGAVNQYGEIQPIGSVIEKIEGFFALCQLRGLTGEQGVIIPQANVVNLMLNEAVLDAVHAQRFHIWAITRVEEGLKLLTDRPIGERDSEGNYPEGSIHHAVWMGIERLRKEEDDDQDETEEKQS